jgi:Domain of unknown function (DUF1906)
MKVIDVPHGARGADMVQTLTDSTAAALKAAGFDFVVRYLGGLSPAELAIILAAGLGVELVTYSRAPGWAPSLDMGLADGRTDRGHLDALGIPPGMVVWIDLEGARGTSAEVSDWVTARASTLTNVGFVAGVYAGAGCVLNAAELYSLKGVTRYWRAFNQGIPEPACGFCQFQTFPPNQTRAGVLVDVDFVQSDYHGRFPTMLVAD